MTTAVANILNAVTLMSDMLQRTNKVAVDARTLIERARTEGRDITDAEMESLYMTRRRMAEKMLEH